ncbi:transglutaminaseTgpA domain-containing protein [Nocardioides speluncae]|uniref:transglutaminase family protein n=1 Tax=Nocardioides speluncae TaxID=2670337 RepID=UPI000D68FA3A|nr:DUF3488 and transglutaminase-like domain-containing protein [Nocardioides speluncae]
MSRARAGFGYTVSLGVAAALTTWVTLFSWRGFLEQPGRFLAPALFGGLLIAATGAVGRWLRLPRMVVPLPQLLVGLLYLNYHVAGEASWWMIPNFSSLELCAERIGRSFDTATTYAAPVPTTVPSIVPLLLLGALLFTVLVDTIACTLGRVPLAGLPLLAIYSLPISVLQESVPGGVFVLSAAGFLTLVFMHESDRVSHWGRPLGQREHASAASGMLGYQRRSGATQRTAVVVGASATALAIVVPLLIPTFNLSVFKGRGPGSGGGDNVKIVNPMTDMVRDLKRGPDRLVLTVSTDDPNFDRLRMGSLTSFDGTTWRVGTHDLDDDQRADGDIPDLLGVAPEVPRNEYDYELRATEDLDSTWLPLPLHVTEVDAPGDWYYDPDTLDFMSDDRDETTAGMEWRATGVSLKHDKDSLLNAPPPDARLADEYTKLPNNIPESVEDLARTVAEGADTPFEEARALQNFLRSDEFTYDLTAAPEGNDADTLESFLLEDQVGYCEQFASAMAVMARILRIPSRVAVGFQQPTPAGDGTWEFTSHKMHAWTEVFISGHGWVVFEPTPADRTGSAPGYTTQGLPGQEPTDDPTSSDSATPSNPGANPTQRPDIPEAETGATTPEEKGFPWLAVIAGVVGGLILLLALALLPRVLRRMARDRRWRNLPPAEAAWEELRATAIDLGLPWPDGRSPRSTGASMAGSFAAGGKNRPIRPEKGAATNPAAVAAMSRLVTAVELGRYARTAPGVALAEAQHDVAVCTEAFRAGVDNRARLLADWLPRSLWAGKPAIAEPALRRQVKDYDDVIDHVG